MKKKERQRILEELMETYEIKRQEDFVAYLKAQGIQVTQATISRDIKEMHLIKVPSKESGYRYSLPLLPKTSDTLPRLKKLLKTSLLKISLQDTFVALKTQPGTAFALSGLLEQIFEEQLFTLLTDDNHVLLIARTKQMASTMEKELSAWIS